MTTVGFYVKAGVETGYGHIVRCLALADELKRRGAKCYFHTNKAGIERLWNKGHTTTQLAEPDYCDVWILDLEDGIPLQIAKRFRPLCKTLVILNGVGYPDGDPGRLLADLVFYQGATDRPATLDWTGFKGRWFVGPEYLILRDEFKKGNCHQLNAPDLLWAKARLNTTPRIAIAGGGSDPKNITNKVVAALRDGKVELRAIVGPANNHKLPLCVDIVNDPPNMAVTLTWADVAVVSYGMTAFECLALGIPTVALSISPDHKASADLVQQQSGCALDSLGEVDDVHYTEIQEAVYLQLARRETLSKRAREFVDGRGAERVAGLILETIQ